uniref:GcrA family cell cycle regulator n=1 Tax=Albidovulum sp. TaxID=1872424 RepID=UPI002C66DDCA|nr:GcrA family cell cycle regulator [Albidovulum sp.]
MSWTDERVETLKKMWADGQSASQIAKELGGVTRNAVIGKVHRLGLSNRVGAAPEPAPKAKAAEPAPKAAEARPATAKPAAANTAPRAAEKP